ncbi:MAG: metal-dependent transcriptional regulator [Cytophagaceae bacterium]|nr:metal-dependent transcriptional regulator [Cytophagaceae bacterium]MDW8455283.1 metal-dependent transcriptional regulator [Cytophagaceae bacterium]
MLTYTEENYIKCIYALSDDNKKEVFTNDLAEAVKTKPASVSDMLKRLHSKKLINYKRYKGVTLTRSGKEHALKIIRKHRLWEVFLVDKLKFTWDQVHEVAEQLEHIQSQLLIERLDEFLGYPAYDPHGDPIPSAEGVMKIKKQILLSEMKKNQSGEVSCLKDTSSSFLQYLDTLGIEIGSKIKIEDIADYDRSVTVILNKNRKIVISEKVSTNIFVSI